MQSPHHPDATLVSQLAHHGRKVAVDIVQMHHIGLEIIEDRLETTAHVTHAQRTLHRTQLIADSTAERHFIGKAILIARIEVLRIFHSKHRRFHPVLTEQRLGIEDDNTVAPTRIVKLIDQ